MLAGRADLLAAFCLVLGLASFIRFWSREGGTAWLWVALTSMTLGILSKGSAYTFALLLVVFLASKNAGGTRRFAGCFFCSSGTGVFYPLLEQRGRHCLALGRANVDDAGYPQQGIGVHIRIATGCIPRVEECIEDAARSLRADSLPGCYRVFGGLAHQRIGRRRRLSKSKRALGGAVLERDHGGEGAGTEADRHSVLSSQLESQARCYFRRDHDSVPGSADMAHQSARKVASVHDSTRLLVGPGSTAFASVANRSRFTEGPAPLSSGDGFLPAAGDGGGRFETETSVGYCNYDSRVQHRGPLPQLQRVGRSS